MAHGMTAERITAQHDDVDGQHQRADANAEDSPTRRVCEPQCFVDIVRQDDEENQRQVEKEAVDVLHDERKRTLAEITLAWFADSARRWIGPEGFVICATIV